MGEYYVVIRKTDELYHHSVKGMKWGVRRDRNNINKNKRSKVLTVKQKKNIKKVATGVVGLVGTIIALYGATKVSSITAHAEDMVSFGIKNVPKYRISDKSEYAKVMHEVVTNATPAQKKMASFPKAIGNFVYTFRNNFDGTYDIIDKNPIEEAVTGILERINDG